MSEETAEVKAQYLSDDLIRQILLRLPVKSIGRFRSVCKYWYFITTDPSFLLEHTRRSSIAIMLPLITHGPHHIQLLSSVASVLPDILRNFADDVAASCDGLLCFLDHRDSCSYYVINPLTGAQIDVARSSGGSGCLMGMYFHQSTGEYRLIRIKSYCFSTLMVDVISFNGEAWKTLPSSLPGNFVTYRAPVDLNGFLYWKADDLHLKRSMILRFDIVTEEFKLIPIPRHNPLIPTNNNNITDMTSNGLGHLMKYSERPFPKDDILVKMGNILGLVSIDCERMFLDHMWIEVWIVKNFENAEWENMYSINCFGTVLPGFVFGLHLISADIAFCIEEEAMMVLLTGERSFLLKFDLKTKQSQMGRYQIVQIVRDVYDWTVFPYSSFLYKESLVSHDFFSNN